MTQNNPQERLHATAVAIRGQGVLLRGAPGAGKSDLALRLIDRGAVLIADDQVLCRRNGEDVMLAAPAAIAGLIEIRGVGLRRLPFVEARLTLVIDLVLRDQVPRLPEDRESLVCGRPYPLFNLHAFDLTAPLKAEAMVISRLDRSLFLR